MTLRSLVLAGCLLLHAACTEVPGGDEADGGTPDCTGTGTCNSGSGRIPDSGPPAAGECKFADGAVDMSVRVVYVVPADREIDRRYLANLEQSVRHVQLWMGDHLPAATSFRTHDPVVEVVKTSHPASWYPMDGDQSSSTFFRNGLDDALAATGGSVDDPDHVWLFYLAADPACGQTTGSVGHIALFGENDLRGLVHDPRVAICPDDAETYGRCRWVGGMAILLSFALGVPEPAGCADSDPATGCDDQLLTRHGYLSYPDAVLGAEQVSYLGESPFMDAGGLPACELDCAAISPSEE